jgi:hypothetical protein
MGGCALYQVILCCFVVDWAGWLPPACCDGSFKAERNHRLVQFVGMGSGLLMLLTPVASLLI